MLQDSEGFHGLPQDNHVRAMGQNVLLLLNSILERGRGVCVIAIPNKERILPTVSLDLFINPLHLPSA